MNIQESAKITDCKIVITGRVSQLCYLKESTLAVLDNICQHNYITVSTDIINVMKSYPFNPKCCVLARFIAVNHFSRLLNMVK